MTDPGVDPRLELLVDAIVELASGDLTVRVEPSPARDTVDAVIVGINLMANELQQVYADMEARVAERTAALQHAQKELERLALTDSLTGLANRTLLSDRLGQAIVRADHDELPPSVILLDLDEFKFINDSLGHGVGDQVLMVVAHRLRSLVRETDTVSRLGGDEFAIVLANVGEDYALRIAQRAWEALQHPVQLDDRQLQVRASIGLRFGMRGQSAEDLLRDADTAMYQAKAHGKSNVQVFEPAMHRASQDRLRVLSELSSAIEANQLVLHYQPIVRMNDEGVVGAEALLRWNHPIHGLMPPSAFIGVAEESGRISELGAWAMTAAVRAMRRWMHDLPADVEFSVHVNLSPIELRRPDIAENVVNVLAENEVPPHRLTVEIAETGLMTGDVQGLETLHRLRAAGVSVAIDDFGTGYSSIAYLRQLPVDAVKVDQSLVSGIALNSRNSEFVQAVLGLIESVGLHAIVEGVESRQQAEELRRLGAEFGQGFYYGIPMPESSMQGLIRSQYLQPVLPPK